MDYVLSTDALTKRYGRFRALDGLEDASALAARREAPEDIR